MATFSDSSLVKFNININADAAVRDGSHERSWRHNRRHLSDSFTTTTTTTTTVFTSLRHLITLKQHVQLDSVVANRSETINVRYVFVDHFDWKSNFVIDEYTRPQYCCRNGCSHGCSNTCLSPVHTRSNSFSTHCGDRLRQPVLAAIVLRC